MNTNIKKQNLQELKNKRLCLNFTQKDLANKIDISTKSYNQKENGKKDFTRVEIIKIASCLRLNKKDILKIFFDDLIT